MKYPLSFRDKCDGNGRGGMRRQKNDGPCTVIFQNTVVILSHVIRQNTVVYDTVYDRLRPYTESVTVDLAS